MSFVEIDSLPEVERKPGWRGRYFDSPSMTFAHYEFDAGSSIVTDENAAGLRAVWVNMRQLSDSVAAAGASLGIELVGRTDPTGSDATNQSLAQQRVDAVTRRLGTFGVPDAMLHGRSVAASQPLSAQDTGEQARINRSVSFEVVVAKAADRASDLAVDAFSAKAADDDRDTVAHGHRL